ncbi:MAG: hypothetical protein HN736_04755 [Anaerolineae bacterium]|nr:hypothetical protein [Anaerolineae bacterium]MBT4310729.1 hypothetical protein [Anaerolineae bacterium]MBT4841732.1 hypothetical protein [Anaerolineae bacterium]MBT6063120.1 hypothetical protein [Anaerolineae bacterium]MBT6321757.1 hypothetical protein [Anaerolineae bacterium]
MKRKLFILALAFALIFSLTSSAFAQSYSFELEKEEVHVYWNDDGTMSLDYVFVFNNNAGAHAIDFVDVGLPSSYRFSSIVADVNGNTVSIDSDYQGNGTGVAVALGSHAIPAGASGRVHVYVGYIDRVLYTDDDDESYASAVFGTTYFGSQYVTGSTDLTVSLHLPPGIQPDESRYHLPNNWGGAEEPEASMGSSERVTYTWHDPNANGHTQYKFGASFPKSYVPESAIVTAPVIDTSGIDEDAIITILMFCCFGFFFLGIPILSAVQQRKRKMKYLPPKIAIEGHGIKRGLTAVESAILMQEPLDKVMTMILFGVIKKDAAEVTKREPLRLKVASPLPEKLHKYEKEFLEAFADGKNNRANQRKKMQKVTISLVKTVEKKMKGFSRRETLAYYKNIMERAWKQIENAGTPEIKSQMYDEALEWTMLDEDFDNRTRDVFHRGPVFVPMWWGRYDPSYSRPATAASKPFGTPSSSAPGKSLASSMPQLPGSDFAASMVTGVQGFSEKVVGNLNDFTNNVTKKTNPVPVSKSSGRSSGGSGCACACACAGCACACAGGGR